MVVDTNCVHSLCNVKTRDRQRSTLLSLIAQCSQRQKRIRKRVLKRKVYLYRHAANSPSNTNTQPSQISVIHCTARHRHNNSQDPPTGLLLQDIGSKKSGCKLIGCKGIIGRSKNMGSTPREGIPRELRDTKRQEHASYLRLVQSSFLRTIVEFWFEDGREGRRSGASGAWGVGEGQSRDASFCGLASSFELGQRMNQIMHIDILSSYRRAS